MKRALLLCGLFGALLSGCAVSVDTTEDPFAECDPPGNGEPMGDGQCKDAHNGTECCFWRGDFAYSGACISGVCVAPVY